MSGQGKGPLDFRALGSVNVRTRPPLSSLSIGRTIMAKVSAKAGPFGSKNVISRRAFAFGAAASATLPLAPATVAGGPLVAEPFASAAVPPAFVPRFKQLGDGSWMPDDEAAWSRVGKLSDEFDDSSIDRSKWALRYQGGWDHFNDEFQRYRDENVTLRAGGLELTAIPQAGLSVEPGKKLPNRPSGPLRYGDGAECPLFFSGMIRSLTPHKYVYEEIMAKLPTGLGVWAAWWGIPVSGPGGAPDLEWDFAEWYDFGPNQWQMNGYNISMHGTYPHQLLWADPCFSKRPRLTVPGVSKTYFADGMHRYQRLWLPDDTITFGIDGVPVAMYKFPWIYNNGSYPAGMGTILNLAIGGSTVTKGLVNKVDLATKIFRVEYIRGFQKQGCVLGA